MKRILTALFLMNLASSCLAADKPQGVVQVFDCDGRQVILIVPQGSKFDLSEDPCTLTERRERPSDFICVEGTCFPGSYVVMPPSSSGGKGKTPSK